MNKVKGTVYILLSIVGLVLVAYSANHTSHAHQTVSRIGSRLSRRLAKQDRCNQAMSTRSAFRGAISK